MGKRSDICSAEEFEARYYKPKPGKALVVGSRIYDTRTDRRLRHADCVGVDMEAGPGVDLVLDLEQPADMGMFAHIDCISVLEHARRPWSLAANIEQLLEDGGTLYLQVPFIWRVHEKPRDLWRFTDEGVRALFPGIRWQALQYVTGSKQKGIPNLWYGGLLYFARVEVCGFGERI